jgi:hypothetical protein
VLRVAIDGETVPVGSYFNRLRRILAKLDPPAA